MYTEWFINMAHRPGHKTSLKLITLMSHKEWSLIKAELNYKLITEGSLEKSQIFLN